MQGINADIKALLSSGYGIDGEAQRILDEGVRGFLQKPFQKAQLSAKVARSCMGRSLHYSRPSSTGERGRSLSKTAGRSGHLSPSHGRAHPVAATQREGMLHFH
jgi:DNA-binding NarL/FixJ family response regulator